MSTLVDKVVSGVFLWAIFFGGAIVLGTIVYLIGMLIFGVHRSIVA